MAYGDPEHEQDLIEFETEQRRDEEAGIFQGDARRCRIHPHVKTSSDDGMFDGPCGECELAMYDDYDEVRELDALLAAAEASGNEELVERTLERLDALRAVPPEKVVEADPFGERELRERVASGDVVIEDVPVDPVDTTYVDDDIVF